MLPSQRCPTDIPISLVVTVSKAVLSLGLTNRLENVKRNNDRRMWLLWLWFRLFFVRLLLHGVIRRCIATADC